MTEMDELLARGREAFTRYLERIYPPEAMPVGLTGMNIITRADFEAHPGLCLDFVSARQSLHVIGADGGIYALLSRHRLPIATEGR